MYNKGRPCMQRKLPGIDIPAATEAKILHAAAFVEFKQHVERLARAGSDLQAYTCWMHGVEVCHSPYVLATGTDSDLFPPLPKMPCCVDECQRCAAHFGGFKFPWLGLWNSRGVVLAPDVAPNEAWDYYYRHQDRMDLLLVAAYTNFKVASDVVPQELYALQLRCTAGDAGQLGLGEVFDQWRTWLRCMGGRELLPAFVEPRLFPRAPRGRPWPAWGRDGARAHRALCGWLAQKKVKDAEKATIDRMVNTWLELRAFLESRGRPAPPEMVDLDSGASSSTPGIEVDEQERRPGPRSEQSAGANYTQGDWAAWPSTSGGASARASPGGPHCGIACGWR